MRKPDCYQNVYIYPDGRSFGGVAARDRDHIDRIRKLWPCMDVKPTFLVRIYLKEKASV